MWLLKPVYDNTESDVVKKLIYISRRTVGLACDLRQSFIWWTACLNSNAAVWLTFTYDSYTNSYFLKKYTFDFTIRRFLYEIVDKQT